jgi:penicillin amidase
MASHQSYRMILDAGDCSKSLAIYAGGQSGQPFTKHWGDLFPGWQRYDFNPLLYTQSDIDPHKEAVLTLSP